MSGKALSGLKVLDLTAYVAGPYCTRLLAGLGAEVIKVEKPGEGDISRSVGPFPDDIPHPEKSGLFLYLNANKKGITLNLKSEAGKKIFRELVKKADVVVEGFAPRVMLSLGLDYKSLKQINPRLIMTSLSNFGQDGPYRDYKAVDSVLLALNGWLYITGDYDREPVTIGGSIMQYLGGVAAATATLTSVYGVEVNGMEAQHIDIALTEAATWGLLRVMVDYSYLGVVDRRSPRWGAGDFFTVVFAAKNGYISLCFYGYLSWEKFAHFLGSEELLDPKFATFDGRTRNMARLLPVMQRCIRERDAHEFFHEAQKWGFPCAVVQDTQQLASCPQLKTRDFFVELEHPAAGTLMYPGAPFKMSETPWVAARAPLLGEHNEEIYCGSLGYGKSEIVRLREMGVI